MKLADWLPTAGHLAGLTTVAEFEKLFGSDEDPKISPPAPTGWRIFEPRDDGSLRVVVVSGFESYEEPGKFRHGTIREGIFRPTGKPPVLRVPSR